VAEDPETAGEKGLPPAVPLDVLLHEEAHNRLRHGEADGLHDTSLNDLTP
jgi:hypothetical protein